ncbi:Conserved oligomeric Golgi complex subunit 8 [Plasmodiophora brassicae]
MVGPLDGPVGPVERAYIEQVTQWDLGRIRREPDRLRGERLRVTRAIEDLAVQNYRQFLDTATCLARCKTLAASVTGDLDAFRHDVAALTHAVRAFTADHASRSAQETIQHTLSDMYPQLVDVLDLPYLMEACIVDGAFDAALDIRDHVRALLRRHADVGVLAVINAVVDRHTDRLLADLLGRLEAPVQLPDALTIVGHMRRVHTFTEVALRTQFLQRREAWLEARLAGEVAASPLALLSKYLDVSRVHLFEIATQYQAMFADDDDDDGLLQRWISHRLDDVLAKLATHLAQITNGTSLATLLEQAMYCGLSLGTIGIDFRALLIPLFAARIAALFQQALRQASATFHRSLSTHLWHMDAATLAKLGIVAPGPAFADVMQYPPLAVLASAVFDAVNQVRECAPASMTGALAAHLEDALVDCAQHLAGADPARSPDLAQAFGDVAFPLMVTALASLAPAGSSSSSSSPRLDRDRVLARLVEANLYSADRVAIRTGVPPDDDDGAEGGGERSDERAATPVVTADADVPN